MKRPFVGLRGSAGSLWGRFSDPKGRSVGLRELCVSRRSGRPLVSLRGFTGVKELSFGLKRPLLAWEYLCLLKIFLTRPKNGLSRPAKGPFRPTKGPFNPTNGPLSAWETPFRTNMFLCWPERFLCCPERAFFWSKRAPVGPRGHSVSLRVPSLLLRAPCRPELVLTWHEVSFAGLNELQSWVWLNPPLAGGGAYNAPSPSKLSQ